jgi:hypothetical protein
MHTFANPDHAQHDTTLIAGHAAGDLSDTQVSTATALLARCPDCTTLHRDLVALSAATRALPRHARAPRDYRLTADQAASLRRGSWLRALLRPFGAVQAARPMAAAFTSLGVAGLLVAAFVPGLLGGAAAGPTLERDNFSGAGAPAPSVLPAAPGGAEATYDAMYGGPAASQEAVKLNTGDSGLQAAAGGDRTSPPFVEGDRSADAQTLNASAPPNVLVVASLGFLVVGLLLFGLRMAARRVR